MRIGLIVVSLNFAGAPAVRVPPLEPEQYEK